MRQCFCTSRDTIDRYRSYRHVDRNLPKEDFQDIPYVMGIPFFCCFCVDLPKKFSEDREHAVIKLHSRESGWAIIGKGTIAMLEACLTLPFLLVFHEFSREFASQ